MKRTLLLSAAVLAAGFALAAEVPVKVFRYSGPYVLQKPVMVDSIDFAGKRFDASTLLKTPVDISRAAEGKAFSGAVAPSAKADYALHLLYFSVTNANFTKAKVKVSGLKNYQLYVDNRESKPSEELQLTPATHAFVLKYLTERGRADSLSVSLSAADTALTVGSSRSRRLTLADICEGTRLRGVSLSHDGRYLLATYYTVDHAGKTTWRRKLTDLQTRRTVLETSENISLMPSTNRYYAARNGQLVATDIATGAETVLTERLPKGSFVVSPTEDYLIVTQQNEGPKEQKDVFEVVSPDDRQPGWRDRPSLFRFDLHTGLLQPLTFGYRGASLLDISTDGRYLLIMTSRSRLMQRPTTLFSILRLDLATMQATPVITDDGFLASARFSPNGNQLVVMGSPESLGGIGKNVPDGRIPSMYDYQLFTIDADGRHARPLTRHFKPGIMDYEWSNADGNIYFTAYDRDYIHLYKVNPGNGKITQLPTPEDEVNGLALAGKAPTMAWYGDGASNSDRLYTLNTRTGKSVLQDDLSLPRLRNIELGTCQAWSFVATRGDTISGRYYLPPHFDASRKYPLIVYYYGGCSPTSRNFAGNYPPHLYAAQGYVVYVINPSGAVGFGQEFSSRHVNTAGKGVADDIIEGTRKFAAQHSYIDSLKIGCIGASYGGFMTQYLQTQTDLFAAAVSHAGISDHTSYWGEGYWGYSYSEVSMAGSYPWADRELYVDQSPLFHADKIHTPLLFLHGNADTNVPIGESIQMYTALKLLGRPTAFVVVDGQNHHILDYNKRIKWQNTIFAWFQKYLKGDASWWDSLYPPKHL